MKSTLKEVFGYAFGFVALVCLAALFGCSDEGEQKGGTSRVSPESTQKQALKKKQMAESRSKKVSSPLALAKSDPVTLGRVLAKPKREDDSATSTVDTTETAKAPPTVKEGSADEDNTEALGKLDVLALSIAGNVEHREPVDISTSFIADGKRVFAHAKLDSGTDGRTVYIVFKRYDREYYRADLSVGKSPRWRTWASIGATKANVGQWTVAIEDENNTVLASKSFEIVAAEAEEEALSMAADLPDCGCND